jgi:hypothetical protein
MIFLPWIVAFLLLRNRRRYMWLSFSGIFAIQLLAALPIGYMAFVAANEASKPAASAVAGLLPYRLGESPYPLNEMHSRENEWSGRDYVRQCGLPIIAPFDGTVTRGGAGIKDGWDNTYIYIKSADRRYEMLIMHSDFILSAGNEFLTGQKIGQTNTHGFSSECHEHISLRVNGKTADPEDYRHGVMLAAIANEGQPDYLQFIHRIAFTYDIEPEFIMGIIQQESAWDARATSSAGAIGLMQLMPGTAADMGVSNAYDPEQNIRGGVRYINWLLNRYNGDKRTALMAYHAGPGNIDRRGPTSLDLYYANQVMRYYEYYLDK